MIQPTDRSAAADPAARTRLLQAAGEVFAEQGFRSATVRAICARAGTNVAAVNYHFRDKESLYALVLENALQAAVERFPPDLGVTPESSAEDRLRAFIRSLLLRMLGGGVPEWLSRLMAHEMIEPTRALDPLVERVLRPLFTRLVGIVGELLGPGADPEVVRLCARSVVGQCFFYRHAQEVIRRLQPGERIDASRIEDLADHITSFSLAGIRERRNGTRRSA
ncbi:MAG: CerR family C-terminal domain-containing protein [Planctomycetota bacterium]